MSSPTGSTTPAAPSDPVVSAWQDALAAEHAAVYGYGELGPHLSDPGELQLARSHQDAHRALRNAAVAAIEATGADPLPSQASYPLPFALSDASAAQRLALRLEEACAAAWRYLIAAAVRHAERPVAAAARRAGQTGLTSAAVRAVQWRTRVTPSTPTVAFPGIATG